MDSSRTYTVAETSAILGIAQSTIYEMVRESLVEVNAELYLLQEGVGHG